MNEKISRREFLKKAGLVSAGAVMGNFILSPKSYARVKGANDRVNVAVVGFSDRFRSSLLPGFTDHREELNFDMIGVSDIWSLRRDEGVQVVGEKIGHKVKGYRNNEEMYKDKDIDAVIISTPDFAHATHTIEAAEHGKHIYVEKPFAETMEDNRRARAAVEKAGVVFQVGSQRRSAPNYHAANDYIRSGQFGDIVMCEMTWNVNQPAVGAVRRSFRSAGKKTSTGFASCATARSKRSTRANTSNIGCSGPIRRESPASGWRTRSTRCTGSPD